MRVCLFPMPVSAGVISTVEPGSVGDEIGVEPGDTLVSINGHLLRDLIDYRFYAAEEELVLIVEREGRRHRLEVERDYDEDLGLEFDQALFDGLMQCDNHCPFCFVNQTPRGLRRSLYVHDDDYRYSFLLGNFVTLTNLTGEDWRRIEEQRPSPLYVSIHATDISVRRLVLGNPRAPDIMAQLRRLGDLGIEVHGQIVVTPGMNDGAVLRESIENLGDLWPTVRTLALVPVGLTRFHRGGLRTLSAAQASEVLGIVSELDHEIHERAGCTWLYPSDELFLLSGEQVPEVPFYDDEAQRENGIGLVRVLLDDWAATRDALAQTASPGPFTLVCGTLIAPILQGMASELSAISCANVRVVAVPNQFFGPTVTVSGLLVGRDVIAALAGRDLGERVFLPRSMFDAQGELTLDDLTQRDLEEMLGVPVSLVSRMGEVHAALLSSNLTCGPAPVE